MHVNNLQERLFSSDPKMVYCIMFLALPKLGDDPTH